MDKVCLKGLALLEWASTCFRQCSVFFEFKMIHIMVAETIFILELDDSAIVYITVSYNAQKRNEITATSTRLTINFESQIWESNTIWYTELRLGNAYPLRALASCVCEYAFGVEPCNSVKHILSINRRSHGPAMHKREIESPVQVPGLLLTSSHTYYCQIRDATTGSEFEFG